MDTNDGRREMRRVDWDFVPEAVVVGNGEFPMSALPLRMLDTASFTVCCDGAADRYLVSGRVPDRRGRRFVERGKSEKICGYYPI